MSQSLEAVFLQGETFRIDYTPSGADVAAGQIVNMGGGLIGICNQNEGIEDGVLGALDIGPESSYRFIKDGTSGPTFAVGDLIGWNNTDNLAVAAADGDWIIGICTKAAGASDDGVVGVLNPALSALNLAGAADLVDLTAATGTAGNTISDVGGSFNQTTLNNNFKSLAAKINEIHDVLQGS